MTRSRRLKEIKQKLQVEKEVRTTASPALQKFPKKVRQIMSSSSRHIYQELDFKEAPHRAGWPTLPPLPVQTCGNWHFRAEFGDLVPFPHKAERIQTVQKILQFHNIESIDVDVVLRVAEFDVHGVGYSYDVANGGKPGDLRLPDEQFLTMLVTLDFRKYRSNVTKALIAIRQAMKKHDDSDGLLIEFLDVHCGVFGGIMVDVTSEQAVECRVQ